MKRSALVLVFLCLVNTHLCGRLNVKKKIRERLTPPRRGVNRLLQAFRPASRRGLKTVAKEAQQEAGRFRPSMVLQGFTAAAAGAAVGAGIGWQWGVELETARRGVMQALRGTEEVPPSWESTATSRNSEQHGSSPAPPPAPQEEEKDSPSQLHHDEELTHPGNWVTANGTFSIDTGMDLDVFVYKGDFVTQSIFSTRAFVVREDDGQMLTMKRSKNTQRHGDDGLWKDLWKECVMARYLTLFSARKGFANCVGERTFEPHEVAALKASQKNMITKSSGMPSCWNR